MPFFSRSNSMRSVPKQLDQRAQLGRRRMGEPGARRLQWTAGELARLHQQHGDKELVAVSSHAQRLSGDLLLDDAVHQRHLHQLVEERNVADDAAQRFADGGRRAGRELQKAVGAATDSLRAT